MDLKNASINDAKLKDYALSTENAVGKNKAIVFKKVLGITLADADWLKMEILKNIENASFIENGKNEYGTLYYFDFELISGNRKAQVRTGWIVLNEEKFPRLTTCFVL